MRAGSFTVKLEEGELYRNVTKEVQDIVSGWCVGAWSIPSGHVHVFVEHTTCTLLLQEDEPCLIVDLFDSLDVIAPKSRQISIRDSMRLIREGQYREALMYYRHDDPNVRTVNLEEGTEERRNGHSHVRASLVGQPFLTLRIKDGRLKLGRWQQILLLDFDDLQERRERTISVSLM